MTHVYNVGSTPKIQPKSLIGDGVSRLLIQIIKLVFTEITVWESFISAISYPYLEYRTYSVTFSNFQNGRACCSREVLNPWEAGRGNWWRYCD